MSQRKVQQRQGSLFGGKLVSGKRNVIGRIFPNVWLTLSAFAAVSGGDVGEVVRVSFRIRATFL
ncbi:MAG TPA: hypothetical protein ACQGQH_07810 [Xylella sp.]